MTVKIRKCFKKKYSTAETRYSNYINTSKQKDITFDISYDKFTELIKQPCHYCGYTPIEGYYNGLDKIDPNGGYKMDNVLPSCWPCNKWRGHDNFSDVLMHCIKILSYNGFEILPKNNITSKLLTVTTSFFNNQMMRENTNYNKKKEKFKLSITNKNKITGSIIKNSSINKPSNILTKSKLYLTSNSPNKANVNYDDVIKFSGTSGLRRGVDRATGIINSSDLIPDTIKLQTISEDYDEIRKIKNRSNVYFLTDIYQNYLETKDIEKKSEVHFEIDEFKTTDQLSLQDKIYNNLPSKEKTIIVVKKNIPGKEIISEKDSNSKHKYFNDNTYIDCLVNKLSLLL